MALPCCRCSFQYALYELPPLESAVAKMLRGELEDVVCDGLSQSRMGSGNSKVQPQPPAHVTQPLNIKLGCPHTLHWGGMVQHSLYAPEISDMARVPPHTALGLVQLVERQIRQRRCDRI